MFGSFGQSLSLLLHVTQHEGRSLEQLLAPRGLPEDAVAQRTLVDVGES